MIFAQRALNLTKIFGIVWLVCLIFFFVHISMHCVVPDSIYFPCWSHFVAVIIIYALCGAFHHFYFLFLFNLLFRLPHLRLKMENLLLVYDLMILYEPTILILFFFQAIVVIKAIFICAAVTESSISNQKQTKRTFVHKNICGFLFFTNEY